MWSDFDIQNTEVMLQMVREIEREEREPIVIINGNKTGWNKGDTYLLTPWSRVLLEKLTGFAANQEIPHILLNP